MTLPIITSRWNHEKKHYQEEIEILKNTPTAPVAKYDFRPKETALATLNDSKTTELTLQKTELAQLPPPKESGSRHLAKRAENPAISTFLNESRISSIRAAGKNSKIVINSRTVPIDGYVNDQLRVRVSKINSNEIVFVDDNGYEYRKQF
jgi:hypothetical protein